MRMNACTSKKVSSVRPLSVDTSSIVSLSDSSIINKYNSKYKFKWNLFRV